MLFPPNPHHKPQEHLDWSEFSPSIQVRLVLHFHYFRSGRIKGIQLSLEIALSQQKEVTNTWKNRTGIQSHGNQLYKSHLKSGEQIQGYILKEKANYVVSILHYEHRHDQKMSVNSRWV